MHCPATSPRAPGTTLWIGFGLGDRRRGVRRGHLRAERGATADAGSRRVPRRRIARPGIHRRCWPASDPACRAPAPAIDRREPGAGGAADASRRRSVPVVFAYDGSELAACAIEQAARSARAQAAMRVGGVRVAARRRRIHPGRQEALRRRPGRRGAAGRREHRRPRRVAGAEGRVLGATASRSRRRRRGRASWRPPRSSDASLIVLGPHRRSGLLGHLQGSVAAAVIAHSTIPVMAIPEAPCRR